MSFPKKLNRIKAHETNQYANIDAIFFSVYGSIKQSSEQLRHLKIPKQDFNIFNINNQNFTFN
ncbi:hypothetical protein SAMN04515674_11191 [Pseudarcicella hirudinis]|uniref:Uncharacterized protein n=1 Tax=Pseudarcicella hirudinis TaxID=1079859 RepID=A0A1I5WBG1_9BACT|nr:hypothetical protein [Pseudarcicella hirudinis]SFQ17029.1 hypothetical protein SAMN04515674_11191 [Pseudarcicella hirudinis]